MRNQWQRGFWTVLAMLSVLVVVASAARADKADKQDKQDADYYELMKVFVDTFEQIERNYVKDINRRELMEAAIQGMIKKLDQYSSYISPADKKRFKEQVDQEFSGIGIQVHVDPQTKRLTVMTPLPGTPAYKAGVRAGDTIMEIEGKSTEGYDTSMAVKLLKGKPGDAVTIGVRHLGSEKIVPIKIVRATIRVATVLGDRYKSDGSWDFIIDEKNKIGYIRLTHFSRRSASELRRALQTLVSAGMQALVLDLRFNPGGLLSQATAISDLFIEKGKIVSTKGRNTRERVWEAKKPGTFSGFPMAVLVNRYSASASEIVSACLQDHQRAVIVGVRTWGKGSVQNIIDLEGGASALKLTTASYHRPSGKNIHKFPGAKDSDEWGVRPKKEFEVKFTVEDMQKYREYRQTRDVLSKKGPPKSDFKDRQLAKAVGFLLEKLRRNASGGQQPASGRKPAKHPVVAPKPKAKAAARGPQKTLFPSVLAA